MSRLNGVEYHGQSLVESDKKNKIKDMSKHIKFHELNIPHPENIPTLNNKKINNVISLLKNM